MPTVHKHLATAQRDAFLLWEYEILPAVVALRGCYVLLNLCCDSGEVGSLGVLLALVEQSKDWIKEQYDVTLDIWFDRCKVHQSSLAAGDVLDRYFSSIGGSLSAFSKKLHLHAKQQVLTKTKQKEVVEEFLSSIYREHTTNDWDRAVAVRGYARYLCDLGYDALADSMERKSAAPEFDEEGDWCIVETRRGADPSRAIDVFDREVNRSCGVTKLPRSNRWFTQRNGCTATLVQGSANQPLFFSCDRDNNPERPWFVEEHEWSGWIKSGGQAEKNMCMTVSRLQRF